MMMENEQFTKWIDASSEDKWEISSLLKERRLPSMVVEDILGIKGEGRYRIAVAQSLMVALSDLTKQGSLPEWVLSQLTHPLIVNALEGDNVKKDGFDIEFAFIRHSTTSKEVYEIMRDEVIRFANINLVKKQCANIISYAQQQIPPGFHTFIQEMKDFV